MRKMPPTAGVGYHELFICRPSQLFVQGFTPRLYHMLWDVALCCVRTSARNALSVGTKALVFFSILREGLSHVRVYFGIPVAKIHTARHFAAIRGGSLTCEIRKSPPPPPSSANKGARGVVSELWSREEYLVYTANDTGDGVARTVGFKRNGLGFRSQEM